jgi:hypothetical protein
MLVSVFTRPHHLMVSSGRWTQSTYTERRSSWIVFSAFVKISPKWSVPWRVLDQNIVG